MSTVQGLDIFKNLNQKIAKMAINKIILICLTLLLAACAAPVAPVPLSRTFVYNCNNDLEFVACIEQDNAWLFLPEKTVQLFLVSSGSGAKYSNDEFIFWSRGEEALFEAPGNKIYECVNDRARAVWEQAKFAGVAFRAVGNEPGWELKITPGGELIFITDYGEKQYSWPTPEPVTDQQKKQTVYTAASSQGNIEVVLRLGPCADTMADITYETEVTVTLNGKKYPGCGMALY